jgi:hypothetical protein
VEPATIPAGYQLGSHACGGPLLFTIGEGPTGNNNPNVDFCLVATPPPPPPPGGEGCTPGYWKNHTSSWAGTGYTTGQALSTVFDMSNFPSLGSSSLLQALSFKGGSTLAEKAQILLRAAVAALLSSSHPGVDYPRSTADVILDVNAALESSDATTILNLAGELDLDNNLGCPLN